MREISCSALQTLLKTAQKRGLGAETICRDLPCTLEQLQRKDERIDWATFCRLIANLRPHFSRDDFEEVGRKTVSSPLFKTAWIIGRLLFAPLDLYLWVFDPRQMMLTSVFTCIQPSVERVGLDAVRIRLELDQGLEACPEFFLITGGSVSGIPTAWGTRRPPEVAVEQNGHVATYVVRVPHEVGIFSLIRRTLAWPFLAKSVARELKIANEDLQRRYFELDEARSNLETKVTERTAELARARDELSQTVIELRAAQQMRQRLFANINHEIRTPLALVTLVVGQLRSDCDRRGDYDALQKLDSINANIRRLLGLVDGLLLLAAGQEGGLKLRPQRADLVALVRQVVSAWRPHAEAHGLSLSYAGPETLVAEVDAHAFERMVANLVSNSAKFTPEGGRITVRVEDTEPSRFAVVVSDTGCGVPAALKPRLFDRFVQGDTPARDGQHGSGIGLSIVKEIAAAHGGTVGVGDNPGGGARFHCVLPRAQPRAPSPPAESVDEPSTPDPGSAPPPTVRTGLPEILEPAGSPEATILVAEDDPELLRATGELLRARYRVLLALDGRRALVLAAAHRPDMLVTDIQMPEMDGLELTRRFRELSGNRLAPVTIVTAFGELGTRLWGFDAGAIDFLSKPFEPEELMARIRSQLALRQLALKLHESEKLAAIGTLTAGLAHELRNPANVVANAVLPLRRQMPPELLVKGHPVGRLLDLVEQNAQQMARLSRDLLGYGPGGLTAFREESVMDLVLAALRQASHALGDRPVRQTFGFDGRLSCCRPLVVQILTNLLENAAHASGPDGEVAVITRPEGAHLVIEVADSGPGVAPELMARIFEPFFTTKPFGQGTGLGLAMARVYVERHHGRISVVNGARGAVFRVELPWSPAGERKEGS